ncbi:MAG TPA: histidinol-phosphatase [Devosiaceae bacterium]|nr:histidinol-phosphatase [Devosiaceae bacterium]
MTQILGGLDPEVVGETLLAAAAAAAAETLPRFRTRLAVDNKFTIGFDPVTDGDREAERAIRETIAARFPDHAIIGEEMADKTADGPFEWIIDPIDGTRAFISGAPVWGTLIGLRVDGKTVAGLMAQPFTGETYLGLPGGSRFLRGAEDVGIRTSGVTELALAKLSATSPDIFEGAGVMSPWNALRGAVLQTRYGLDCYAYCLLAAGHIDLVCEAALKNVDIAPLIPLIENAGGVVTTWDGASAEQGGNCLAAATPELHAAALAVLNGRG